MNSQTNGPTGNSKLRLSLALFGVALAAASVLGQQSKPTQSGSQPQSQSQRHIACWKQVGISPAAMQQRRAIMEAAKAKIEGICNDDTLSAEQKKQQIHEIHQQAVQQAEALIPAAQAEALKKCQQEQGASSGAHHAHPTSPCGEPLEPTESSTPDQN
jgi:hypothetical protein